VKKVLAALVLIVPMTAFAAATSSGVASACSAKGYSKGNCGTAKPGHFKKTHVPGVKGGKKGKNGKPQGQSFNFRPHGKDPINVVTSTVACPKASPKGAQCFRILMYDSVTGKKVHDLKEPITFNKDGFDVYVFHKKGKEKGKWTLLWKDSKGQYASKHPRMYMVLPHKKGKH